MFIQLVQPGSLHWCWAIGGGILVELGGTNSVLGVPVLGSGRVVGDPPVNMLGAIVEVIGRSENTVQLTITNLLISILMSALQ